MKFRRPARKSWSLRLSVEATSPATSIRAPCPTSTPLGLIRNTLPFEDSVPRMTEGSKPTTRFRTLEFAPCWMNRVASAAPTENPCQLMIVPGLLTMLSDPP